MTDEDRFDDLGGKSAAERLAERDRTHPEEPERRPEIRRPGSRYAWVVGIVLLMGVGVLLFTTALPNRGEGVLGPDRGKPLPEFAAPLVTSNLEGDANIRQRRFGGSEQGRVPACDIKSEAVLNSCTLEKRPVVLTFVFDRAADCNPQVDRVERVKGEFPNVNFATVYFSRKDRPELREIVRRRRWTMPVAVDRDGQVNNLYGVGVCPTTVFAKPGGRVVDTALGNQTEAELRRRTKRILEG
jgi:peroxiredoxin